MPLRIEPEDVDLRAKLAFKATGVVSWEADRGAHLIKARAELAHLFALSEKTDQLDAFLERVTPEDLPLFEILLDGSSDDSIEFRIRQPDGATRWLRGVSQRHPVRPVSIGALCDITERKEMEDHLKFAVEGAALGSWHYNVKTRATTFSRRWAEMLGHSLPEIEPTPNAWETRVHPEDRAAVLRAIEDHVAGATPFFAHEHRLRHKDGHWVWVLTQGKVIRRDAAGNALVMAGTNLDMTDRHKTENALRTSEARIRAIMEAAPIGITYTLDKMCSEFAANPVASGQFEVPGAPGDPISAQTIIKQNVRYFLDGRELSPFELPLMRAISEAKEIGPQEIEIHMPSGRVWFCEARGAPVRDSTGDVVASVALSVDITARKRAEERERLLLGEINHRAKNLLAVVQAITKQTLAGAIDETSAERLLDRLRALSISHDLIVTNSWQGVDLATLAEQSLRHFGTVPEFRIKIAGPKLLITPAAAQTLGMCFHELATNAAKYGALDSPEGRILLTWRLKGQDEIEIAWRETGIEPSGPPTLSPGFGYRVLVEGAPYTLDGKVHMDFTGDSLTWRLEAPASRIVAPP